MKTVAVTGGIGSGKSTVCSFLSARGITVYDTDSATKKLYVRDDSLLDSIEEAFGCSIRLTDGTLDKEKLASIIFDSPDRMRTLEGIVHPAVGMPCSRQGSKTKAARRNSSAILLSVSSSRP